MKNKTRIFLLIAFFANQCWGQWSTNPAVNNPLCLNAPNIGQNIGNYHLFRLVGDGTGGAYACWFDQRNTAPLGGMDIILQHISAGGYVTWPPNGLTVCNSDYNQRFPEMTSDGSGGVIITWENDIDGKVYAQRVDVNGNLLWPTPGVVVCNFASGQFNPNIIRNENGEVTIVWKDTRGSVGYAVYAQRLDMNGNRLWSVNGMEVSSMAVLTSGVVPVKLISDGNSGIIACWQDIRNGSEIYAQRLLANGSVAWAPNGVLACNEATASFPSIITDGAGGAIFSWSDNRNQFSTKRDVFAQRIDATGNLLWSVSGAPVCTASENQDLPQMIADGSGGAIISWRDFRIGFGEYLYAQRINGSGITMWTSNGLLVTAENGSYSKMTTDESGGALIVWSHTSPSQVRVQRISPSGIFLFAATGAPVSTNNLSNGSAPEITSIGQGNSIVAWLDYRNSGQTGIYASRLLANGTLPVTIEVFSGKSEVNGNLLNWTTSTEQNNRGFDIERSNDGVLFQTIGFVAGSGNASTRVNYSFLDPLPLHGKNYYRLKQIDVDGLFKYSKIILLQQTPALRLMIFPNPATTSITIQSNRPGEACLTDINGKIVSIVYLNGNSTVINISGLRAGIYYFRKDASVVRFVKQLN